MKPIRFTNHAREQAQERGASETEIRHAIASGSRQPAKHERVLCRFNFPYDKDWQGRHYRIKQVAPIIQEKPNETVVITVYTFYF
jgi:hypothetical protein